MKKTLLYFVLLIPLITFSQTQIGSDIDAKDEDDWFGHSVSLSSNGGIVAIGSPRISRNPSGSVSIYQNISGTWSQIGSNIYGKTPNDRFGWSVSLSADGNFVAIGAPYTNNADELYQGLVRVYKNTSGVWSQIGADINGEAIDDEFGYSVSLSSDGNTVAIGAPSNDGNGDRSGSTRVYNYNIGAWTQIGSDIDGEDAVDNSGTSVSLSSDGSIVAIGADLNDGNGGTDSVSGHVRIYQIISGEWLQVGSDINGEYGETLGVSVSLSSNGDIVAMGGDYASNANGDLSGTVRIYSYNSSVWTQIGADIYGEDMYDNSGASISLSGDGKIVAIGAPLNLGNNSYSVGSARIYKYSSNIWTQIGSDIDGEYQYDEFGSSVSLSSDGSIVAIGAPFNIGNGNGNGSVSIFNLSALLSLEDNYVAENFKIYPNPASSNLQITLNSLFELQSVKLYNVLGQPILDSKEKIIDVSCISKGVYYLEITTNQGKGVKKVIIE